MSRTQRFLVNLIFDPEYDGYVADVPQLPGCMSQGKTVEAALTNVRKAITTYLKASRPEKLPDVPEVLISQVEVRVSHGWRGSPDVRRCALLRELVSLPANPRAVM